MKSCSYCGRENQDEAFVSTTDEKLVERRSFGWFGFALRCFILFIAIACFYFLSLGPVTRYFCRTTRTPVVAGPTSNGVTTVQTMTRTYPGWVGIVYYPAFTIEYRGDVGLLYSRYIQ